MGNVILFAIIGVVVLFIALVAWMMNSRWAGERDWVYNRYNTRRRGGGSLGLLESIYQPTIEHVIEERASERARGSQDESGDKPDAGSPGDGA